MKILHLMLSCFYIDNFNYQENILPRINKKMGHEVKIIASTETFINGKLGYLESSKYYNEDNIEVVRLNYKKLLPRYFMRKIRAYKGLYKEIDKFRPNIILSHGLAFNDIKTVVKYKKKNPEVKLYLDSHEESQNSALNFISNNFLHKFLYRSYLKNVYNYVEKIFYLSPDCKRFVMEKYKVPAEKLEYWPLGGEIIKLSVKEKNKEEIVKQLNIGHNKIIFTHSGKFDKPKRTEELLRVFSQVKDDRFIMIVAGIFLEDVKLNVQKIIDMDSRIIYVGWKKGDELIKILCATDIYCQPGSVSATLQNSLCCGCTVMAYPHEGYKIFLNEESCFYVETEKDMKNVFDQISSDSSIIDTVKEKSYAITCETLDYEKIALKYTMSTN
jgi:glycosyltransferase involved in cell wall biosynthesis